jgi:hypothetical protein
LALSKIKKKAPRGQRFAAIPDIQRNLTLLRGILGNDFQNCFRQQHDRLMKCTASQGQYFEGDSSSYCRVKQILLSQGYSGNSLIATSCFAHSQIELSVTHQQHKIYYPGIGSVIGFVDLL